MDGPVLMKLFVNINVRKISHIDVLLTQWDKLFFLKCNGSKQSSGELYFQFLSMLLLDDMSLHIENGFIYFQKNDIIKMQLTQFSPTDNMIFLERWFLLFRKRRTVDEARKMYDYDGCMLNHILDQTFPRYALCARYISLALKQTQYNQGALTHTWHDFNNVAGRLLLHKNPRAAEFGRGILRLLHERHLFIHTEWNENVEVYPGINLDNL